MIVKPRVTRTIPGRYLETAAMLKLLSLPIFELKNRKPIKTHRKSAILFRMRTASIQRAFVTRPVDVLGQLESNHPSYAMLLQRRNTFHGRSSIFQFPRFVHLDRPPTPRSQPADL
jgi:hypothetical protein